MAEEEEAVPVAPPPVDLDGGMVEAGLSDAAATLDGCGIAYTALDVSRKNLKALPGAALARGRYVRFLHAAYNPHLTALVADDLAAAKELVTLSLPACGIKRLADLSRNTTLQHLDLTANALVSCASVRRVVTLPREGGGDGDGGGGGGGDADGVEEDEGEEGEAAAASARARAAGTRAAGGAAPLPPITVGEATGPAPAFTFAAPSLLVLLLNRNKLAGFEGLTAARFRNLTRLEACNNALASLAIPDDSLPALQELILTRNKLKTLAGLASLPALRILNVDWNEITSLAGIVDAIRPWAGGAPGGGGGEDGAGGEGGAPGGGSASGDTPLAHLTALSIRNNALPEDAWHELDGLRPLSRLTDLRLAGNPLVTSAYKPRELELKVDLSGWGALLPPVFVVVVATPHTPARHQPHPPPPVLTCAEPDTEGEDVFTRLEVPEVGPLDTKQEVVVRVPQLVRIDDELVTPGDRRVGEEEADKRAQFAAALAKAGAAAAAARAAAAEAAAAAAAAAGEAGEGVEGEGGGDE